MDRIIRHSSIVFYVILLPLLLMGCNRGGTPVEGYEQPFEHARLLTLTRHNGYTVATIASPWQEGSILHRYILVPKSDATDISSPADKDSRDSLSIPEGTVIRIPLTRAAVFTTSHAQLLCWFHRAESIAAVADLRYMNIPEIHRQVAEGKTVDCGDAVSPDIERLILSKVDAVLLSPFANSGGYGSLETIGIPIIECADYMESTPLGRAEWMKFYGLLFGCEGAANNLFRQVEDNYRRLSAQAARMSPGLTLLTERRTGSVWYVPGGESTTGQIIKDAGAGHPFPNDRHSGSLPLSPEQVLARGDSIGAWAVKRHGGMPLTPSALLAEYDGYKMLRAFREGNVYECDTEHTPFFEETAFRPDRLLGDFITITHPQQQGGRLRYYKKIE